MNTNATAGPFHAGELRAQSLIGVSTPGAVIRSAMPDQHRAFFQLLPYALFATTDHDGWPLASIATGAQGFISSPDPHSLHFAATAEWQHEMKAVLQVGSEVGVLGIDFNTRRRNRANGVVHAIDAGGIQLCIRQSFGNCPKYIQAREVHDARHMQPGTPSEAADSTQTFAGLDDAARRLIAGADTFFVATTSGSTVSNGTGVDISHRGGRPGFICIDGNTLTIPDFAGNKYFNTLGNMLLEPRAALLFIDFSNGDLLHLQGHTEVLWNSDETGRLAGAERLWRFHVMRGWHRRDAIPLRWTLREFAPTTVQTGVW